jgi:protein-disulfide isomerase
MMPAAFRKFNVDRLSDKRGDELMTPAVLSGAVVLTACLSLAQAPASQTTPAALRLEIEQLQDELRQLRQQLTRKGLIDDHTRDAISIAGRPSIGVDTASVVIVEFADFDCPFCLRHARSTFPEIRRRFVETGVAQYVVKSLPLEEIHPGSLKAAVTAECLHRQNSYWPMRDVLFDAIAVRRDMMSVIRTAGVDTEKLSLCLGQPFASATIRNDIAEADRLGVQGTPTFVLGPRTNDGMSIQPTVVLSGLQSIERFAVAIEAVLGSRVPTSMPRE